MTPLELELRGQLLYGRYWQKDLARNVGVDRWTVSSWKAGRAKIKPSVEKKIEELMARRVKLLRSMIASNYPEKLLKNQETPLTCGVS